MEDLEEENVSGVKMTVKRECLEEEEEEESAVSERKLFVQKSFDPMNPSDVKKDVDVSDSELTLFFFIFN